MPTRRDARSFGPNGRGRSRRGARPVAVVLAGVGAYLLALALVGFFSNLLPGAAILPLFFVAAVISSCASAYITCAIARSRFPKSSGRRSRLPITQEA